MIPLRTFGLDLQKPLLQRDHQIVRTLKERFTQLDDDLRRVTDEWLEAMLQQGGRIDPALWLRWQRSFLNALHRPLKDAYDDLGQLAQNSQKAAFLETRDALVSLFSTLYPSEVVKVEEPRLPRLEFEEAPIWLIPDREIVRIGRGKIREAIYRGMDEEQANALTWGSLAFWTEYLKAHPEVALTEAQSDPVKIQIGAGKVAPEFLRFLSAQVDTDVEPGKLIRTMSADHLKFVQGVVLGATAKGEHLGWAKDKIADHLAKGWKAEEREHLEKNVMRILRTSHNRAANASLAYFAAQNPVVAEMERVADGRPCAACCPRGTRISMEDDDKPIEEVAVGDKVQSHKGRFCVVTAVMSRLHTEGLIVLKSEEYEVCLTLEHPVLTARGWVPVGCLTVQDSIATEVYKEKPDFEPVVSLEYEPFMGLVYNLEVKEDNSYIADGIVVHNCFILDGTRYPIGVPLVDHPHGMCVLTPVVKSLEELGFRKEDLPPEAQRAWTRQARPHPPLRLAFYDLPEKDQQIIMGKAVHALWKKEDFPLEVLARRRPGGWFSPVMAKELQADLANLGGLSHPKVGIGALDGSFRASLAEDRSVLVSLDPRDRANLDGVLLRGVRSDELNPFPGRYGQNLFGVGVDGDVPDAVRAQAEGWLFSLGKLPDDPVEKAKAIAGAKWQEFNEYARSLNLYTRKGRDGRLYHILPTPEYEGILKKVRSTALEEIAEIRTWQDVVEVQRRQLEPLIKAFQTIKAENDKWLGLGAEKDLSSFAALFDAEAQRRGMSSNQFSVFLSEQLNTTRDQVKAYLWQKRAGVKDLILERALAPSFVEKSRKTILRNFQELSRLIVPKVRRLPTYKDDGGFPKLIIRHQIGLRRAHYNTSLNAIVLGEDLSAETIFHEFGHHMETDPRVRAVTQALLRDRTKGETAVRLLDLYDDSYGENEVTKKDRFWSAYIGKEYPDGSTEVLSMGLQNFTSWETAYRFWQIDPEHFYLTVGILKGRIPGL